MTGELLRIDGGSYAYGREIVLKEVNLSVYQGDCIALLGANGSGKTTLLKVLAGLYFLKEGEYCAFTREITAKSMEDKSFSALFRRKLGIVFQNSDVQLFCATVREEILFGLRLMGLSEEEAQARAGGILSLFSLEGISERAPHQLSGGQKKKVALAAVLATNPDILLLDEPMNGLDPKTRRWLLSLCQELKSRGKTIILSTHLLDMVEPLCERVLLFGEDHEIIYDGAAKGLLQNQELLEKANIV